MKLLILVPPKAPQPCSPPRWGENLLEAYCLVQKQIMKLIVVYEYLPVDGGAEQGGQVIAEILPGIGIETGRGHFCGSGFLNL